MTAIVVADASVIVKWFSADRPEEDNVEAALQLLYAVFDNRVKLRQPPHWLAEIAAVLTRLSPETAIEDIADLHVMEVDEAQIAFGVRASLPTRPLARTALVRHPLSCSRPGDA